MPAFACRPRRARSDGFVLAIADDDVKPIICRGNKHDLAADVIARYRKIDDFNRAERRGPTPANQHHRSDGHDTHNLLPRKQPAEGPDYVLSLMPETPPPIDAHTQPSFRT